ncbi:hypothetical protein Xen7305DRAFT_00045560 [Xenococcus sp. PCC 7305]|uniref:hypothetical protein n=1 Tax=Xenococcus sp. PCC 7305 TaxID=102125 RepID=UPI0002ACE557|nr:hypothetical protein [Xenococcus sp. PCC 7305]ELS04820.1 hypothetical protein Xen7305DRAFT_00045560 [Xenococcus sp. PCC 7305]
MSNESPSYDEGWEVVARELSEIPNWEKLTYRNGIIHERPIPATQLELFSLLQSESDVNSEVTEVVSDTQIEIREELLAPETHPEAPGSINEYCPGKRKVTYFRFSYRDGSRVRHKHIRGGNTSSQLGQANAQKIRDMIARGYSLADILQKISQF